MNSSSVPAKAGSPRSSSRASWRRRIWRGEATTSEPSSHCDVGQQHHRALVPGHRPQRVQVGLHHEVPVAAVPGGHRVAADRLHVDVHGQQVVAALGAVLDDVVEEMAGRSGACPAGAPPCPRWRGARCPPCPPLPLPSAHRASHTQLRGAESGVLHIEPLLAGEPFLAPACQPIVVRIRSTTDRHRRVVERLVVELVVPWDRRRRERQAEDDRDEAASTGPRTGSSTCICRPRLHWPTRPSSSPARQRR